MIVIKTPHKEDVLKTLSSAEKKSMLEKSSSKRYVGYRSYSTLCYLRPFQILLKNGYIIDPVFCVCYLIPKTI